MTDAVETAQRGRRAVWDGYFRGNRSKMTKFEYIDTRRRKARSDNLGKRVERLEHVIHAAFGIIL